MSCDVITGCINEDSTFTLLARVHVNGAIWAQSQVSTITYSVWDTDDAGTAIATGSVTVSASVFDALQTDGRWTIDVTGYNFRHTIAHTVITEPGTYRIEYKVTLSSGGEVFFLPFVVNAVGVWTS